MEFRLVCLECWKGMPYDIIHSGCTDCPHCGNHEHGTQRTCEEIK